MGAANGEIETGEETVGYLVGHRRNINPESWHLVGIRCMQLCAKKIYDELDGCTSVLRMGIAFLSIYTLYNVPFMTACMQCKVRLRRCESRLLETIMTRSQGPCGPPLRHISGG